MMKRFLILLALSFAILPQSRAALALQSFDANKHHRFANNPAFIGSGYDWSGVARASNGRWVTMISETHFLTAQHSSPGVGNTVTFHEDNDPSGTTHTRTIAALTRVGTTDIRIGRLLGTEPALPPTIAIYAISAETTSGATFGSSIYSNKIAFNVGLNNTGSGTTQFRVGRNELDGFYDVATVSGTTSDAITFDDDRGTPQSLGDDESFLQSNDSGAPMFIPINGELALVGANWFITTGGSPNFSGTSFLPNHLTEIQAILDASGTGESLTLISVPEPSTAICLVLGVVTLLHRRR